VTSLEIPDSGSVKVFGFDVTKESMQAKRRFGLVHQEIINSGFFDVEELLNFQAGFHGLRRNKERNDYLLQRLSLYEHRHKKVKQLSGGMKRRLMIAKALVHSPKLLLLDEPTAGVDLTLRENLWDFVRELRNEGIAILLTTHYLEEAELLCDRVGIIHKGQIQTCGPTKDVIRQFTKKKVVLETLSGTRKEFLVQANQTLGEILVREGIEAKDLKDLTVEEGTLEDAFRSVLLKDHAGETL
jgi:ABC-2 type transport system ATP-binding protein